jgi:asparagine synthetase B (glutamine-hydrolysing)
MKIIASEMKSILSLDKEIGKNIDKTGIISYISLNGVYGRRTLFEDINIFPSGSVNRLINDTWKKVGRYAYPEDYDYELDFEEHALKIATLFKNKLDELYKLGYKGLFLSGGLDSRLILSAYNPKYRSGITGIHIGNELNTDSKFAAMVGKEAGIKFKLFETRPEIIIKKAEEQAWATEGALSLVPA